MKLFKFGIMSSLVLTLAAGCGASREYSHYDMGLHLLNQNKADGAIDEFKLSLTADPADPTVHEALASVYYDKGYKDQAIIHWEKTMELSSENPESYGNGPDGVRRSTAWVQDAFEARKKASQSLQKALNERAEAAYKEKRTEDAVADWKKVVALNAENLDAWKGMAITFRKTKQYQAAFDSYREVANLAPKYEKGAKYLGYMAFALGNLDMAEKSFDRYIVLAPDDPLGFNNMGTVLTEQKRYGLAVDMYAKALNLKPNLVSSLNGRATAYYYKKDYEKARADWSKVLDLEPENATAKENIRTLVRMGY